MPVQAIVGAQWGDEGKGKITDLLAQDADLVMRYGGGSNAGHTVVNRFGEFKLHVTPCGIFNPAAISLIGTGTVVDFESLGREIDDLQVAGVDAAGLRISSRAHVVMPYHRLLDRLSDEARGAGGIGTTRQGVGPAYVDKADRTGIQAVDLLDPVQLRRKLEIVLPLKNALITSVYQQQPLDLNEILQAAEVWRERFGDRIVDAAELVWDMLERDRSILLEGQLGALRDIDWGTYPYVTSSTTLAGGGGAGGGIPPRLITTVVGVVKAYTTAVGAGPLPTELDDETGNLLRQNGREYGATTGRPRRVGWFDAVAARYACRLSGFTGLAITKLDVLDGLPSLRICVAYRDGDTIYTSVPPTPVLERVVPVYEEVPGWAGSAAEAREWTELPPGAQSYVRRLAALVGAPVSLISVGPERDKTIMYGT